MDSVDTSDCSTLAVVVQGILAFVGSDKVALVVGILAMDTFEYKFEDATNEPINGPTVIVHIMFTMMLSGMAA